MQRAADEIDRLREALRVANEKPQEWCLNDKANQIAAFKEWYDAQWLGDEQHGQSLPQIPGDPLHSEYMQGYVTGLGAWLTATETERNKMKIGDAISQK